MDERDFILVFFLVFLEEFLIKKEILRDGILVEFRDVFENLFTLFIPFGDVKKLRRLWD